MARLARLYAPSIPQYVVQRAADGRSICVDNADYAFLLETLEQAVHRHGLALHAYVLLSTEFRLLATSDAPGSLPGVIQDIGRRYVPYANARAGRPGALWHGRFRSTLVDPAASLLAVMRHLERRPVATGAASEPGAWRWSSHAHHVGDRSDPFVQDHAAYWALDDTPFGRQAAYRAALDAPPERAIDQSDPIEAAVRRGWAFGEEAFIDAMAGLANRRVVARRPGRPRRTGLSPFKT